MAPFWSRAVIDRACEMFGISHEDFVGKRRFGEYARARFAAAYVLRFYGMSYHEIGRKIGGRDHTTIIHAVKQAAAYARYERGYAEVLAELIDAACPGASESVQLPAFRWAA